MTLAPVEVVEFTDPVCSWAWGTEPKLRLLRWRHEHKLAWRRVMGGLIHDLAATRPDWDPVRAAAPMQEYWQRVSTLTGQPYPHPMRRHLRSTDPAGRAVKAAELQGEEVAQRLLRRIRESIFIFGVGPDTPESIAAASAGIDGLDLDRWRHDVESTEVAAAYAEDWAETRRPNEFVRTLTGDRAGIGSMKHSEGHDRYAFPTLIFRGPGGEATVPGWMPYEAYAAGIEQAEPGATADPRPDPTAAEAFERWPVLTAKELEVLCGPAAIAPPGTTVHNWGDGVAYFTPAEAHARNI